MAHYKFKHLEYIEHLKSLVQRVLPKSVLESIPVKFLRSWLFQGALYMDWRELLYRCTLEIILIMMVYTVCDLGGYECSCLYASIIFSHTLMWLLNGHLWALSIGKGKRMAKNKPEVILNYFDRLNLRLQSSSNVTGCTVFGSLSRGEFTENSDIDIIICRKPGFVSSLLAYSLAVKERVIAFFNKIPIELYCYDLNRLEKLDKNEKPLLIKDETGEIIKKIPNAILYKDYQFHDQSFFKDA